MKKNGFIVILLLVVIAAAVLSIRLFFHPEAAAADPTPPPAATAEQQVTAPPERTPAPPATETPEPTPDPTPAPTPTPEPTEIPEETPEPTEPPAPESAGSFASDTGTWLNLLADWTVYTDAAGHRKLDVALSATHYSLNVSGSYQALTLTVDGRSYAADSPAIDYDGAELMETPLYTFTLDAPSGSVDIEAVWNFRGSYSGQDIDRIVASGTAYLG